MPVFAVTTAKGPNWDHARGIREQPFWDQHAAFADMLAARGVIILGGPVASDDSQDISLLAVEAADEDAVRSAFDADPWIGHQVYRIRHVRAWTLWLGGRYGQVLPAQAPACARCGREVRVSLERYELFERMHYVCFHYEFEHGPFDPDEECDAGGCPSSSTASARRGSPRPATPR